MSRIEKNQPVVEEMEEMERRITGAVKRRAKPGWRLWLGLAVFALFAVFAIFIAWTLAASGLVRVPVLSSWAYAAPQPARVVGEGVPFDTVAREQALSSSVAIPEATLTTELRGSLETSGQSYVDADRAQVAVLGEQGIELFLPLRDNASGSAIVIRLVLSVGEDGALRAAAEQVSVGSWKLGAWLRESLVNPALDGALAAVTARLEGQVSLSSVRAESGILRIVIDLP